MSLAFVLLKVRALAGGASKIGELMRIRRVSSQQARLQLDETPRGFIGIVHSPAADYREKGTNRKRSAKDYE